MSFTCHGFKTRKLEGAWLLGNKSSVRRYLLQFSFVSSHDDFHRIMNLIVMLAMMIQEDEQEEADSISPIPYVLVPFLVPRYSYDLKPEYAFPLFFICQSFMHAAHPHNIPVSLHAALPPTRKTLIL